MKTKAAIITVLSLLAFPFAISASELSREELIRRLPKEWAPLLVEGCFEDHWCVVVQNEANTTAMGEQLFLIYAREAGAGGWRATFQSRGQGVIDFSRLMYSDTYLLLWQAGTGVRVQTVSWSKGKFRQTFPEPPLEYGTKDPPSLLQDPRGPEAPPLIAVHVWNACASDEGPCADTQLYRWDEKKSRYQHFRSASWGKVIDGCGAAPAPR